MKREGEVRIPSGCAISAIMNKKGKVLSGQDIIKSIAVMHERSNGLGGGFAAYGIYPEYNDCYALHLFYDDMLAKENTEHFINKHFDVKNSGKIPTRKVSSINRPPIIWRYFVKPKVTKLVNSKLDENEFVARCVMNINKKMKNAFVFSSGKNMGTFKGVGYPEDIGEFYRLDEYKGYIWTAHGRFPTNTPGWWGGAHPFTLLDWSVVHNGEISSYQTNKRYLEEFGYNCTLQTDTEVVTYLFDLLNRKHKLPLELVCAVLAPPFYKDIERMSPDKAKLYKTLRAVYGKGLMNGPFSIIVGSSSGIVALNDRIKLRPLIAATKDEMLYIASEESAIREICNHPEHIWTPGGSEPVIGRLEIEETNIEQLEVKEAKAC